MARAAPREEELRWCAQGVASQFEPGHVTWPGFVHLPACLRGFVVSWLYVDPLLARPCEGLERVADNYR